MRKIPGLLLVTGLAAGALWAEKGVVYEFKVTDHGEPPQESTTTVVVAGRKLKIESGAESPESTGKPVAGGLVRAPATVDISDGTTIPSSAWTSLEGRGGGAAIYLGDRRELVIVDSDDETYTVIDQQAIESVAGQVGAMMAQVQEALKNVPQDQRAAVEEMMKKRMPQGAPARPRREVRRTGDRGDKAGYPCVKYEELRDGRVVRELWVTPWDNLEGSAEVRQLFDEIAAFFKEMMDAFAGAAGELGGTASGLDDSMFELFDEIDGFPVVTRDLDADGSPEEESTLRSARRRTIDPAAFEPPAGYKRRTMGPQ